MRRVAFLLRDTGGDWLGGRNYFRNLVTALRQHAREAIMPVLFVAPGTPAEALEDFDDTEIVRTQLLAPRSLPGLAIRIAARVGGLGGRMLLPLLRRHRIDLLSHDGPLPSSKYVRTLGWIPDFQHKHMSSFFSDAELLRREAHFKHLIRACDALVVSSETALRDLHRFAPHATAKTHVLHFCPQILTDPTESLAVLQTRYGFNRPYFHLPNQFWAHKNHGVVVEALAELAKSGVPPLVIATGRTNDYRNPSYYPALMARVAELGMSDHFLSLGVVPYGDMLSLMRHARAVINPSLFEGWSTTVEEAKAYGKMVVLSDLEVHREQAPARAIFFDPRSPLQLAQALRELDTDDGDITDFAAYEANRKAYASTYVRIVEAVCSS